MYSARLVQKESVADVWLSQPTLWSKQVSTCHRSRWFDQQIGCHFFWKKMQIVSIFLRLSPESPVCNTSQEQKETLVSWFFIEQLHFFRSETMLHTTRTHRSRAAPFSKAIRGCSASAWSQQTGASCISQTREQKNISIRYMIYVLNSLLVNYIQLFIWIIFKICI